MLRRRGRQRGMLGTLLLRPPAGRANPHGLQERGHGGEYFSLKAFPIFSGFTRPAIVPCSLPFFYPPLFLSLSFVRRRRKTRRIYSAGFKPLPFVTRALSRDTLLVGAV